MRAGGPVPPRLWGPPPDRPQHIALWAGREGDPHGETTDPGLLEIERILRGIDGIGFVYLDAVDVVRHRLVKEIIDAYATADAERESM